MLLDIYYHMFWWAARCAANITGQITIPLQYFADGKAYENIIWNYYKEGRYLLLNGMLSRPYAGILSQTANAPIFTIGGANAGLYTNFILGSGTTPVKGSDYQVEQEIVDGLALEGVTVSIDDDTKTVTYRKTVRNTSDQEITVREVGLTGGVFVANGSSGSRQVLIYREVLEAPVTIAPGDSATFRIVIRHELPV